MPAKSQKQARLFRAALGNPKPGTGAAKIKATVSREKIKHFTHTDEAVGDDSLQVLQAVNILANYIVANGPNAVKKVEELLKNRVKDLKHKPAIKSNSPIKEVIKSMVKEVLNEMTAK